MISTKIHGYLDYAMGLLLLLIPFIFHYNRTATSILFILGISTIIYSLMTKYELGPFKLIPMKIHLGIDFFAGIFLIASPWLFGFANDICWVFVILGAIEVSAVLLTKKRATPLSTQK